MRNRLLWTVTGVIAFFAVMLLLSRPRHSATGNRSQPNSITGANATADSSDDFAGRPGRNETTQERRERMMSDKAYRDDFKLSEQDVYLYVQAKGSNALSLVAGFESTRNKDYLKAAVEKFPDDPFVQAKALLWLDLSPDERAKMLDAFKKSAPTNAFANFLAAQDAMKRGDAQTALAEITAAGDKGYNEFDRESTQGLEDAYLAAGHDVAEAKTLAMAEVTLPQLVQFKGLGRQFIDLAEKAAASGDTQAQQNLLMMNWEIGQKLRADSGTLPLIAELVGIAMQNATLSKWPAGVDFDGRSATDVLASNAAERNQLRVAGPIFEKWFPTAPEDEIINYMDTIKSSGERQAMAWLKEQHPEYAQIQAPNN
jgi:hypothetical protein